MEKIYKRLRRIFFFVNIGYLYLIIPDMKEEADESLRRMRGEVGERLRQRNSKYSLWLNTLRVSGYLLKDLDKGKMFEADYLWLRQIDDIADGDLAVPQGYTSPADYVTQKLDFLLQPNKPKDDVEQLMLLCGRLSQKTGLELSQARRDIVESMLFDAQRLGTGTVFPEAVLQEYFYKCDIAGTIKGTLPLFGDHSENWPYLYDIGCAVRIYYNLRDFSHDVRVGFVNISQEDMERFRITTADLLDTNNLALQAWFREQAQRGLSLLETGGRTMRGAGFGRLGQQFVHLYHERPARKFLQSVLVSN